MTSRGGIATVRWLCLLLASFVLIAINGCESGYVLVPATLNLVTINNDTKPHTLNCVTSFLNTEGFDALGQDNQMIALIERSNVSDHSKQQDLARLRREVNFNNATSRLRVVWTDYIDADIPAELPYSPIAKKFIEVQIYESRPDGFSARAIAFYQRFQSTLRTTCGVAVIVVRAPVPADESGDTLSNSNAIVAALAWCALLVFPLLLVTSRVSVYFLHKLRLSTIKKQVLFVLINSWLLAPIPLPVALAILPLPNAFAFPWSIGYYVEVAPFAITSFLCTIAICTLMAILKFKQDGKDIESA